MLIASYATYRLGSIINSVEQDKDNLRVLTALFMAISLVIFAVSFYATSLIQWGLVPAGALIASTVFLAVVIYCLGYISKMMENTKIKGMCFLLSISMGFFFGYVNITLPLANIFTFPLYTQGLIVMGLYIANDWSECL